MRISSIISRLTLAAGIAVFSAPTFASAAEQNPANALSKAVKNIQKSVQTGFLKNGKALLKADRKAQKNAARMNRSFLWISGGSGSDTAAPTPTPTPGASPPPTPTPPPVNAANTTTTHSVVFGVSCPGGGRFFFSGTAVTETTTGAVTYRGLSTYNNCGSAHVYGINTTEVSVIPATSSYSADTNGLVSATTSLCSGVQTNLLFDLSFDGVGGTAAVEGQAGLYCQQTQIELCTFPAGTPVNNQLSTLCVGSL